MSERIRYQLSASVFVLLMKDNEICMLKREGTDWMDGSFSIPAGGLDDGETIRAAAIREAYEEVGVKILPENLQYVHTLHSKTGNQTWLGHFFRTTAWEGVLELPETDKHSDLQWRDINTLPTETIPYVKQAILSVAAQSPYSEFGW
ncbi:NUDIX hydrolase [Brucella cytisi]|uniref:NUDIX hydrolase n=1 Tax=Brucella cytisi TaxID=407152 RepID=UPI0035DA868E